MKAIFTNKTDVRLGFEVECVVCGTSVTNPHSFNRRHTSVFPEFKKSIIGLKSDINIGYDGSINCRNMDTPVELQTPPLPPKDAMKLLEDVFTIVNKFGLTNKSCGFHVNISSAHKSKMRNFNPLPFLSSRLWSEI